MLKRFEVGLSFPGEHREFVAVVADFLSQQLGIGSVFYDQYYEAELVRPNLDLYLQDIYLNNTELNVIFVCTDYAEKEWCGLEWRAIRQLIMQKKDEQLMFIRFDEGNVPGFLSIDGYVPIHGRPPSEIATLVIERLDRLRGNLVTPSPTIPTPDNSSIENASFRGKLDNGRCDETDLPISEIVSEMARLGSGLRSRAIPAEMWIPREADDVLLQITTNGT